MNPKSALIIKVGAIGDAIMALPLARELKRSGYESITWLGGRDLQTVLALVPEITEAISLDERALLRGSKWRAFVEVVSVWRKLWSVNADTVFLLHADARYRLLVPLRLQKKVRQVRVGARRHHTFDYSILAFPDQDETAIGIEPYTLPAVQKVDANALICLFPGGARNVLRDDPLRRWPLEHYVRLTERLIAKGQSVAILGGPTDSWIEPSFAHLRSKIDWQVGALKLDQSIKFLQTSALAVSHDAGPLHMASLANCPVISLFGPTNSEWVVPLAFRDCTIELEPKLPCQPCYDGKEYGRCSNNLCMKLITPERVLSKIENRL